MITISEKITESSIISSDTIRCPFCDREYILERYANGYWMKHDIPNGAPYGECDCGATFYFEMPDRVTEYWIIQEAYESFVEIHPEYKMFNDDKDIFDDDFIPRLITVENLPPISEETRQKLISSLGVFN